MANSPDQEKLTTRKRPLKYKILGGTIGILILAMVITHSYFAWFYNKEIRQQLEENLRVARSTYLKVNELQVSRMNAVLHSIQASPRFVSAVEVAIGDLPTLKDTLKTEYIVAGADLMFIADDNGYPLLGLCEGVRGFLTWPKSEKEMIQKSHLIQIHMDDTLPNKLGVSWGDEEVFEDLYVYRGNLYRVISAPIYDTQDNFLGILIIGTHVNQKIVKELKDVTGAEISFLTSKQVFATSMKGSDARKLTGIIGSHQSDVFKFSNYLVGRTPLKDSARNTLSYIAVKKSMTKFYDDQRQLTLISAAVFAAVLLLAVLISLLTSNRIVRPLQNLAAAFRKVGSGDLNINLDIHSGDEIEELSVTFNEMVHGLKQKETMSKFLTGMEMAEVEAISDGGKELDTKGDKKTMSIMFSDIRSFTTICESSDPQIIIDALNYYFDELIPLIDKHNGSLDKLIGDCIMAVFEHDDDNNGADNALQACIAMQSRLSEIRPLMIEKGMPEFHAGFGVNTGISVVGNVGTANQLSRTVLGDAVNLAARVESLSKEGKSSKILFTDFTLESSRLKFESDFLMEATVKGKSIPVKIYEIADSELNYEVEDL